MKMSARRGGCLPVRKIRDSEFESESMNTHENVMPQAPPIQAAVFNSCWGLFICLLHSNLPVHFKCNSAKSNF